jgi:hypothetical protein
MMNLTLYMCIHVQMKRGIMHAYACVDASMCEPIYTCAYLYPCIFMYMKREILDSAFMQVMVSMHTSTCIYTWKTRIRDISIYLSLYTYIFYALEKYICILAHISNYVSHLFVSYTYGGVIFSMYEFTYKTICVCLDIRMCYTQHAWTHVWRWCVKCSIYFRHKNWPFLFTCW